MARLPDNMKVEKGTNGAFANIQINFTKEEVRDMVEEVLRENDYTPVVHAHWIDYVEDLQGAYDHKYYGVKCSHCGTDPIRKYNMKYETVIDLPYCCECGAKMDEEETR